MRILRTDQMDNREAPEEPFRDDRLRELVDALPARQRHLVSRVYFGGDTLTQAAAEIKLETPKAKALLTEALEKLRRALQTED